MRKNKLIYLMLSVLTINLVFLSLTSYAQTSEQAAQSEIEEKAQLIYKNLSPLSMRERRELFSKLTPELKSELWRIHLKSYLSKNPDLTDKQIKTIEAIRAFLTPKIYEISQNDPNWEQEVNRPFTVLLRRLQEEFPNKVARELLRDLGGSDSSVDSVFNQIKYDPSSILDCNGNTATKKYLLLAKRKNEIKQPQQFVKISASSKTKDCDCSNKKTILAISGYIDDCDCSVRWGSHDCPASDFECQETGCQTKWFCGPGFVFLCNGECIYVP